MVEIGLAVGDRVKVVKLMGIMNANYDGRPTTGARRAR